MIEKNKFPRLKRLNFPPIGPIKIKSNRPLWSVMIPTYNCAGYLGEALEGVLRQDPGPNQMQIEVVDDCSNVDDPEKVIRKIGKERVSFFRQPRNIGAPANFNACIRRAKGYLVHILHGDDRIESGFYDRLQKIFDNNCGVGAAFCRYAFINKEGNIEGISSLRREESGILTDFFQRIAVHQLIQFPAIAVKRSVYETLGGFDERLIHACDWEMWKRISVYYPFWYEADLLAYHRSHSLSDSSRLLETGANWADIRKAIIISESYLPKENAMDLSIKARECYAKGIFDWGIKMFKRGNFFSAIAQIKECICMLAFLPLLKSIFLRSLAKIKNKLLRRNHDTRLFCKKGGL